MKILGGKYYQLKIEAKEPVRSYSRTERFRLSDFTFNILPTSTTLRFKKKKSAQPEAIKKRNGCLYTFEELISGVETLIPPKKSSIKQVLSLK